MFISELFDRTKRAHREGIDLEAFGDQGEFQINATSHGRELGRVLFDIQPFVSDVERKKILVAKDLMILPEYRGQGIAAIMYDYAKELGYEVQRSYEQTDAGAHFWDKNRGPGGKVWEAEQKTLDPELYEELPNAFLKRIVANALPGAPLKFKNTPEGYLSVRADDGSVKLDIGMGIHGGDIGFHIENAYLTKHQGAGVMTKIISDAYQAVERKYGRPQSRSLNIMQDRSHGAWQAIANKLGAEYYANSQISEITLVPTVAKSKREHLDVMPNDGRPIPEGKESEYLGDLVAEMGRGYQLWSWTDRGTVTYYVFDTNTRTCQLGTTGRPYTTNRDSFVVQGVYSGPKNRYRAADLYAFLIINRGLTLVSDNKQSEGGYRVWQELEQRYGRRLNIHGFDTRTNEPVNLTTQDEPDTHVARSDVKRAGPQMKQELGSISRDLRFVASAK